MLSLLPPRNRCLVQRVKTLIKALIRMNKAATLASLYTILIVQDVQGQQNTIKVDRNILLILHKAYDCL